MQYDLSLSTYYYGFRNAHDDDVLVSSDDWNDLAGIVDSPEFRLWALDNGYQYFGIWRDGIGYWQALGTRLDAILNEDNEDNVLIRGEDNTFFLGCSESIDF
jgi:hypothetical protein